MSRRTGIMVVGAALLTGACHHEPCSSTQSCLAVSVRALYTGLHCGRADRDPAIEEVASAERLEHVYARLVRGAVIGQSAEPPDVSFDEEIALLIEMGEQPTAGYRLGVGATTAPIRSGVAEVRVEWVAPADGAITAQMITSPCILIGLDRGPYASVRVIDQHHQERLQITVR